MKKRIFILTLASLMLICSCGAPIGPVEDVYEEVDPSLTQPNPPQNSVNYASYEFTVLTAYAKEDAPRSIFADETQSSVVNEEIAKRNAVIEKNFNIILKEYQSKTPVADIEAAELTGLSPYDMAVVPASDVALLISGGKLVDLAEFSAFDQKSASLDAGAVSELSIGGKLYGVTGDLITSAIPATSVVLCNNAVQKEIDFEKEFGKTPAELAKDGEWTLDIMFQATAFANAKGSADEKNDLFFGFREERASVYSLCLGALGKIFEKDGSDIPSLSINGSDFSDVYEKVARFDFESEAADPKELFGVCGDTEIKNTNSLFSVSTLGEAKALCESGLCFTILPMPKYDEDQKNYACRVDLSATELAVIPASVDDLSRSALVFSALFEGSGPVKEEYLSSFKSACKHDFSESLSLVLASGAYDLGDLFGWGDFAVALADTIDEDEPGFALSGALEARALAADKAMDILLKRLLGEDYKEQK